MKFSPGIHQDEKFEGGKFVRGRKLISDLKKLAKLMLRGHQYRPVLGDHPYGGPSEGGATLLMVCREGFNGNLPNANSTIRLGFCRGFAQIGIPYKLVSVFEIHRLLPRIARPIVFLTCYDYLDLSARARRMLRDFPHFIWVPPWFAKMAEFYETQGLPMIKLPKDTLSRILNSGATFVWAPVPPSCLSFYEEWQKRGQRVESIPFACDTERYFPERDAKRFSNTRIAFVGGYWAYKSRQFEKYLRPYEDLLTVYGYSSWPYKGYGGRLSEEDERVLYKNAKVCPAISEPHAELNGDIGERAFKVMGSGGLAVTDVTPFYRELFSEEELLMPGSLSAYHDMIRLSLEDADFNQRYRQRGFEAIIARHTYAHRALSILGYLGRDDLVGKKESINSSKIDEVLCNDMAT